MLEQPWISLHINLQNTQMQMKLLNGKTDPPEEENPHGIGIQNVKKRLGLLYPQKHEMIITSDNEVFIVNLKIELNEKTETGFKLIPAREPAHA